MSFDQYLASLEASAPPQSISTALAALWWAKKDEWENAHSTAQADHSAAGAWVHAYLHRVEGDADNAAYWYGQAGREPSQLPLEEEWESIAKSLVAAAEPINE